MARNAESFLNDVSDIMIQMIQSACESSFLSRGLRHTTNIHCFTLQALLSVRATFEQITSSFLWKYTDTEGFHGDENVNVTHKLTPIPTSSSCNMLCIEVSVLGIGRGKFV